MADRQKIRLSSGIDLAFRTAGKNTGTALLLMHGFPTSSRIFRKVIEPLSERTFVVAPDLPGHGASDVMPRPSFSAFADGIEELLAQLKIRDLIIYLHDFGAPVGLHLAMRAPEQVLGLIIQNANAHRSGMGPQWAATEQYWATPNAKTEAAATTHMSKEGVREQYLKNVPPDVAARVDPDGWIEDWRVLSSPGRIEMQRKLLLDYGNYVARFDEIATYLAKHQPKAMMMWGRHDAFFDIAEVESWLRALPRMEAHILDSGHHLLDSHSDQAARFIGEFLARLR